MNGPAPAQVLVVGPADVNLDGFVDFIGYPDYLTRYDAQDARADLGGDGTVDFSDYLELVLRYDRSC